MGRYYVTVCLAGVAVLGVGRAFGGGFAATRPASAPGADAAARRAAEFFAVFNMGYSADNMPKEADRFERLARAVRQAGYTAMLCKYTDERAGVCRKVGLKMMVDLLVPEHHVFRRPEDAQALCRKLRNDPVVLAYHLWSDRYGEYGAGRKRDIDNVHAWDPTHATYCGTYRADGLEWIAGSDYMSYYDFHWTRGLHKNLPNLLAVSRAAAAAGVRFGRCVEVDPLPGSPGPENVRRMLNTINTSIAFGLKGCFWFTGLLSLDAQTLQWNGFGLDVIVVHKEILPLGPEIVPLGNALGVYTTPVTADCRGTRLPRAQMPKGLEKCPFPPDFPLLPVQGELVLGAFRDPQGKQVFFAANHNAALPQEVACKVAGVRRVSFFDRKDRRWRPLPVQDGCIRFRMDAGGGELVRFEPNLP